MPIINVNSFQNGISKSNYLTSYTDAYLKQSLANLGQRTANKGDSIGFSSFSIQDLFPNYTGDFNEDNLLVQILLYPDENKILGYLKLLQEDGSVKGLSDIEANSKFEINNINNVIRDLTDDYDEDHISLSSVSQINNVDYWHKESATFCKTSNSLIYKLVGHKSSGAYGSYDNEYICEEVLDDGTFVEGFRIFIINENNLMQCDDPDESGPSSSTAHERLCLVHLHKNYNKTDENLKDHSWVLDVYRVKELLNSEGDPYYIGLGDAEGLLEDSRVDEMIAEFADSSNSGSPSTVISNIVDTIVNGSAINTLSGLITKLYSVPVDYNTESNAYWSVPEEYIKNVWSNMPNSSSFSGTSTGQLAPDSDLNTGISADIDIIKGNTLVGTNGKLEYFASDVAQLYPRILEVYNEVMYKSSSNIKMKQRILAALAKKCWQTSVQNTRNSSNLYVVYMPTDYEFKYNCNSNDESIIYNMSSSVPVQFDYINDTTESTVTPVENNVKFLKKIVHVSNSDTEKYIFANNTVEYTVLYDMGIEYSELDDTIITNITWDINFIMPYISTNGYWVINGIETTNYAKGIANDAANFITIISDDLYEFQPSKKILSGVGIDTLKALDGDSFEKKTFKSNYMDTSTNVSGANVFDMQAWVPSDEYLASVANTESFAYLSNAIIMNVCSTTLEKDAKYIQYAYFDGSNILHPATSNVIGDNELVVTTYTSGKYNKETYEDWAVGADSYNSYIYRIATKPNTIESILGGNGIVTSFWTCTKHKDYDTNTTYYAFDYVTNPSTNSALDFNYICNLEQYIKYYSKTSFSPDDFEHSQLVFDPVIQLLKNNTNNSTSRIWPVILNHNADYYNPTMGEDVTKGIGMSSTEDQQYYNSMNLAVEFVDNVQWNANQKISSVENTYINKRFHLSSYTTSYLENYSYYGIYYDEKDVDKKYPKLGLTNGTIEREVTYGVIPKVINYTNFKNEYIPNSEYTPNGALGNQYPTIDLKEATLRNVNTWNRANFLVADKVDFNTTTSYGVIYGAYIGSSYTEKDKSVLHIGTSETNPNLGTTSMTGKDDIHMLTRMKKLSVDFDNIDLNGYVGVKGEIISDRPSWTTSYHDGYRTYSTLMYPISELENNEEIESGKIPSATSSLLSNVKFINRKRKHTRYFDSDCSRDVSYLNIAKLLNENGIPNDEKTVWHGDATLLTKRDKTNTSSEYKVYKTIANLQMNYPGVLQYKYELFSYLDTCTNPYDVMRVLEDEDYYWGELEKCSPNYNEWKQYNLASTCKEEYTYLYGIRGNNISDIESYPIISYKVNFINDTDWTYIYNDNGEKISYQVKGNTYTVYFDNVRESLDQSNNIYLELSTDLTDPENILSEGNKNNNYYHTLSETLVATNPIQVSYTDVASYLTTVKNETYTYITTYMRAASYTEYWTCDGCDLCSEKACPMINKCTKSKCQGFFVPAYANVVIKETEVPEDIINEPSNVYTYYHKRYRLASNKKDYEEYEVKSYWPATKYMTRYDFDVESDFDKLTTKIENGLQKRLTYYKSTGEYKWEVISDINSSYIATSFPVGQNYICAYDVSYVASFLEEYGEKGYKAKIDDNDASIIRYMAYEDTEYKGFTFTYSYLYQYDEKVNVAGIPQEVRRTVAAYTDPIFSRFSYCDMLTDYTYMVSTIRHINVRELMTSHTVPEFYNERLVKIDANDVVTDAFGPNDDIPDGIDYTKNPDEPYPNDYIDIYRHHHDVDDITVEATYGSDKITILYNGEDVSDNPDALYLATSCDIQRANIPKQYKAAVGLDGNLKWIYDESLTQEWIDNHDIDWYSVELNTYYPCISEFIGTSQYVIARTWNNISYLYSTYSGDPTDLDQKVALTPDRVKKLQYEGDLTIRYQYDDYDDYDNRYNIPDRKLHLKIVYHDLYETHDVFKSNYEDYLWAIHSTSTCTLKIQNYTETVKNGEKESLERQNISIISSITKTSNLKYFDVTYVNMSDDKDEGVWRYNISPKSEIVDIAQYYYENMIITSEGGNTKGTKIEVKLFKYGEQPR